MYDLPKSQETLMQRPFELSSEYLRDRLEEMVQVTLHMLDRLVVCSRLPEFSTNCSP